MNERDQHFIEFFEQEIAMSEHGKTIITKTYPHENLPDRDRELLIARMERYEKIMRSVFWHNDQMWKEFCKLFKIKET